MVCLGNICRSPLAEGILKGKAGEANLNWEVDSAGTGAWHVGELPDPRSIRTAQKHQIDITDQRARQFNAYDLETFDLIFAMDQSNYRDILRHTQSNAEKAKVHLIMNMVSPGQNIAVPDPYYGSNGFENVYCMLDQACNKIIENYGN